MNVGDLVRDLGTGDVGIITRVNPVIVLETGEEFFFDYEVLAEGQVFCVDEEEIEKVQ